MNALDRLQDNESEMEFGMKMRHHYDSLFFKQLWKNCIPVVIYWWPCVYPEVVHVAQVIIKPLHNVRWNCIHYSNITFQCLYKMFFIINITEFAVHVKTCISKYYILKQKHVKFVVAVRQWTAEAGPINVLVGVAFTLNNSYFVLPNYDNHFHTRISPQSLHRTYIIVGVNMQLLLCILSCSKMQNLAQVIISLTLDLSKYYGNGNMELQELHSGSLPQPQHCISAPAPMRVKLLVLAQWM